MLISVAVSVAFEGKWNCLNMYIIFHVAVAVSVALFKSDAEKFLSLFW